MNKKIVLVLDANQRSALAVTRSVGSLSDIQVLTSDCLGHALAGASRFSQQYIVSPSPDKEPVAFIHWLAETIKKYAINLLLPVTEVTSQLILMNRDKFPNIHLPFSNYEQVLKIADKANLVKLASNLGIRVPATRFYRNLQDLNLDEVVYPCVLKPSQSQYFEGDKWVSTMVRIVESAAQFKDIIKLDTYLDNHEFMIQEYISGAGAGIFCYFDHGSPKVFFAHRRVREKPPGGGVSVLSESTVIDMDLKEIAVKLLDSVKWHGVAMVEFRISPNNEAYLMEINTRFWGSLQLSIDSGVDFPKWVCTTELGLEQPAESRYREGRQLRWLLGDFDSLYLYMRSSNYSIKAKCIRIMQFLAFKPSKTKHEINRLSDFMPAVYEFKQYVKDIIK